MFLAVPSSLRLIGKLSKFDLFSNTDHRRRVVALNAIARFLVSDMQRENPRLILNDFGAALIGADEFYRDDLHPNAIPASWVNGDRLLWELKRATLRDL